MGDGWERSAECRHAVHVDTACAVPRHAAPVHAAAPAECGAAPCGDAARCAVTCCCLGECGCWPSQCAAVLGACTQGGAVAGQPRDAPQRAPLHHMRHRHQAAGCRHLDRCSPLACRPVRCLSAACGCLRCVGGCSQAITLGACPPCVGLLACVQPHIIAEPVCSSSSGDSSGSSSMPPARRLRAGVIYLAPASWRLVAWAVVPCFLMMRVGILIRLGCSG
jgi:hypothetical protein